MNYVQRDAYGMYKEESRAEDGAGPGPELMGADTLLGTAVYSQSDEELGDIAEIMLDMRSGQVAYAVLSFGGFLGMREQLFAVPWSALTLDTEHKRFVVNVDKEHPLPAMERRARAGSPR